MVITIEDITKYINAVDPGKLALLDEDTRSSVYLEIRAIDTERNIVSVATAYVNQYDGIFAGGEPFPIHIADLEYWLGMSQERV